MMKNTPKFIQDAWHGYLRFSASSRGLLFIPLIIMGGRLVARIIMNTWNMIED